MSTRHCRWSNCGWTRAEKHAPTSHGVGHTGRTRAETIVCLTGSELVMALQTVVLGAVIFGMFPVSTATASAWYHLPALFDTGWKWALANAAMLLEFAIAVDFTAAQLKRLRCGRPGMPLPAALAWLPALLFVKVLMCFLVPEGPAIRPYREWAPPPSRAAGAVVGAGGGFSDGGPA